MLPNTEWGAAETEATGTETEAGESGIDDLVLVSNRQPYRHTYEGDGEIAVDSPAGGLTAGLDPVMRRLDGTWVAWGDGEADYEVVDDGDRVGVPPGDPEYTLQRLHLSEEQIEGYYEGYANRALWPLCHTATGKVDFDADHWRHYRDVNEQFADAVLDHADPGSTVWFQDYHFALAPRLVQTREPDAFVMHFYHIPWPSPDVFRICPQREALLEGLLGNDLLGFHLPSYCDNFLECVDALLDDAVVDWADGRIHYRDHVTTIRAFPLGVDADAIRRDAAGTADGFWDRFTDSHGIDDDTSVALGVDRLDYTKGIPQRLEMLERLWETRPELRGKLTYVQKGCETREGIPAYQQLRAKIEDEIDRINDRFGTDDWQPIVYTTEMFDREELFTLYHRSDLALVTPLRDGMNLVSKEYVASQIDDDGVLLLSRFAGVHEEFGDGALTVDPYDVAGGADAIERALEMDGEERRARMRSLRRTAHEADLDRWLGDVLDTATRVRHHATGGDPA